jgi:creatinine amidohydrolase/Fe(II)-dependent formamide hydrolase-like protein
MQEYSKKIKREIRTLSEKAYKRELVNALSDLQEKFSNWNDQKIDVFQLDHEIYLYHVKTSRAIFKKYNNDGQLDMAVASAAARGVLEIEELSDELHEALKPVIKRFSGF